MDDHKLAAKQTWVGEVEASDEREAMEKAAKEFKQPAREADGSAAAMTVWAVQCRRQRSLRPSPRIDLPPPRRNSPAAGAGRP